MSNLTTSGSNEKSKIFETVLSCPGMNKKCKVTLTISRYNILMLGRLIEAGLSAENKVFKDEILTALPVEILDEFNAIHQEILNKGHLSNFYEKLKEFKESKLIN